ncbi:MAG: redoxin domain-containing protein [Alphaproteobacteria bacterium]|nr:redoxin domain-containing protein [Alphaproteobacteria bacterium]
MTLQLGQIAPDFEQDTTNGSVRFHQWLGGSWCLLFDYSTDRVADGIEAARLKPEWSKRSVKVIGLSAGSSDDLADRQREVEQSQGFTLNFPVIADADRTVAALYGTMRNGAARHVFLIDADKTIRLMRTYAAAAGCDFAEILRAIDDLQRGEARTDSKMLNGTRPESDSGRVFAS